MPLNQQAENKNPDTNSCIYNPATSVFAKCPPDESLKMKRIQTLNLLPINTHFVPPLSAWEEPGTGSITATLN